MKQKGAEEHETDHQGNLPHEPRQLSDGHPGQTLFKYFLILSKGHLSPILSKYFSDGHPGQTRLKVKTQQHSWENPHLHDSQEEVLPNKTKEHFLQATLNFFTNPFLSKI